MLRPHPSRRATLTEVASAALIVAVLALVGCASGDPASDDAVEPTIVSSLPAEMTAARSVTLPPATSATDAASLRPSGYCDLALWMSGERPESYVGSPEHLADVGALIDVAPDAVLAPLRVLSDFLESGAIVADDPESNVLGNWPPAVQASVASIVTYNEQTC